MKELNLMNYKQFKEIVKDLFYLGNNRYLFIFNHKNNKLRFGFYRLEKDKLIKEVEK